jgi:hypothetical protein
MISINANKSSYETVLDNLKNDGIHQFGSILDRATAANLYRTAIRKRDFGPHMFLSEGAYRASPQHFGVNPKPGFNYLEQFSKELASLEKDAYLIGIIERLLGAGYWVHNKKFVCGIPDSWIPDWLRKKMQEASINNLGAYMRPEYRDITYFHGIDFHQDIIDWPSWPQDMKTHEFVTLYLYIHDVSAQDAPLIVLPRTHIYGANYFPHRLTRLESGMWKYTDDRDNTIESKPVVLTGETGYAAIWHPCFLHGTQYISDATNMRLSLRYILSRSKNTSEDAGIDEVNALIEGPLYLPNTRKDLDQSGKVIMNKNHIVEQSTE